MGRSGGMTNSTYSETLKYDFRRHISWRVITYEEFKKMAEKELDLIPEYCFEELNGGVILLEHPYLSPKAINNDLYILGQYSSGRTGKQILLYFGSFVRVFGEDDIEGIKKQIRETIRHEFRHHMETRAGMFGKGRLIEEDKKKYEDYVEMHRKRGDFP